TRHRLLILPAAQQARLGIAFSFGLTKTHTAPHSARHALQSLLGLSWTRGFLHCARMMIQSSIVGRDKSISSSLPPRRAIAVSGAGDGAAVSGAIDRGADIDTGAFAGGLALPSRIAGGDLGAVDLPGTGGAGIPRRRAGDPHLRRVRRPQRHEDPEDDDADYRHQNDVAVSFHYQCLQYIEALIGTLAIPTMVPAMTWASVGGGATTTGGPTPLGRSDPVLRFVLPRQKFGRRSQGRMRPNRKKLSFCTARLRRSEQSVLSFWSNRSSFLIG